MPKSKRAKVVHLTNVQKKTKEHSVALFDAIRETADKHTSVFVFSVENMRNTYLKDVRTEFSDSRIFFGKTKVMAKALGSSKEDEYLPGLAGLNEYLVGTVGLLFTSREPGEVLDYFETYSETDFARAGVTATRTFTVPAGVVYSTGGEQPVDDDVPLPHSVEVTIRKWGMPTRLDKGKVILDGDYTIAKEGQVLNSHQAALLKLFGVAMAEFKVQPLAYWSASSQEVTPVEQPPRADGVMAD
ncbi:mRNA turnover and ribosome assembly protein [Taxawa tesnikishii (nom. ined.)]|nr:mRNA turnover and ribosome assembly protein [Dothideales sp. JES 119]